jgi:hypothetical protein
VRHHGGVSDRMALLFGAVRAALRGRQALVLENLLLRQQLAVALRSRPRPRLRRRPAPLSSAPAGAAGGRRRNPEAPRQSRSGSIFPAVRTPSIERHTNRPMLPFGGNRDGLWALALGSLIWAR